MLVEGGSATSVSYVSQTMPIPANKPEIAVATALGGMYLGMKMFYLDAGSGAQYTVPFEMIRAVRKATELPLFVGGGIRTPDQAAKAALAGADIIVVGTAIEQDQAVLPAICQAVHSANHIAERS
jgi:putative glycerol-1-phosphate prenyltransferase